MSKNLREIKKATRKYFSAEKKINIVLEGLRGEITVCLLNLWDRMGEFRLTS